MRRDEPNRHGRAADALIASYVRELLEEEAAEPATPLPLAAGQPPAAFAVGPDAVGTQLEATV